MKKIVKIILSHINSPHHWETAEELERLTDWLSSLMENYETFSGKYYICGTKI